MNDTSLTYKEEKKIYLQSYINLNFSINTIQNTIESFKIHHDESLKNITDSNIRAKIEIEINTLTSILINLLDEKINLCRIILISINQIENEIEKNVLILRYINGYKWDEICEIMNYSLRQIYNIHNNALLHFKMI